MSYMALYRKWRPDEFQEVKGQEHIVTTLKNQIKNDKTGHAYLFCGTRGTGKTTIAKLLAKAVNCSNPVDGSPCNSCESCKAIAAGTAMNVIEIDAASNNGVDNIRQITDAVQYSPSTGSKLVYIIDEVHMLSKAAFNALLKTLEEPPAYVMFILATTEAHMIPATIMSRCQRYDFRRISIETISDRLQDLLEREQVEATREALDLVARAADGSMRDALSILDQCIAFNLGEQLTYDKVLETIGAVDIDIYVKLMQSIIDGDTLTAINIIDDAVWNGKDLTQVVKEFISFVRNVLVLKLNPNMTVEVTSENISTLIELGKNISENILMNYINILQETEAKLSKSSTKKIALEVAIIKMMTPKMQTGTAALEQRINQLEKKIEEGDVKSQQIVYVEKAPEGASVVTEGSVKESVTASSQVMDDELSKKIVSNYKEKYNEATFKEIMRIVEAWPEIVASAMKMERVYLSVANVVASEGGDSIDLIIKDTSDNMVAINYFSRQSSIENLEEQIAEFTGRVVKVNFRKVSVKDYDNSNIFEYDLKKINFNIDVKY